jgi:hypothetical protein
MNASRFDIVPRYPLHYRGDIHTVIQVTQVHINRGGVGITSQRLAIITIPNAASSIEWQLRRCSATDDKGYHPSQNLAFRTCIFLVK